MAAPSCTLSKNQLQQDFEKMAVPPLILFFMIGDMPCSSIKGL
jgi:hypothetical protein